MQRKESLCLRLGKKNSEEKAAKKALLGKEGEVRTARKGRQVIRTARKRKLGKYRLTYKELG